jgi:hypothetical protein
MPDNHDNKNPPNEASKPLPLPAATVHDLSAMNADPRVGSMQHLHTGVPAQPPQPRFAEQQPGKPEPIAVATMPNGFTPVIDNPLPASMQREQIQQMQAQQRAGISGARLPIPPADPLAANRTEDGRVLPVPKSEAQRPLEMTEAHRAEEQARTAALAAVPATTQATALGPFPTASPANPNQIDDTSKR